MYLFVVALHVLLCLVLIFVILLQPGKNGDAGAFGASNNAFGPRGPTTLLAKVTTGVAVLFMVTSITLALWSNPSATGDDMFDDRPKTEGAAAAPGGEATPIEGAPAPLEVEAVPVAPAPADVPVPAPADATDAPAPATEAP